MSKKKCIFHIPNHINLQGHSGSNVRPIKMLQAFREIGYDVEYVMGYGQERKERINRIKSNIMHGIQYDFLYSESSTMPTLLTEKNHLPRYPGLDFGFFKFCKKHGIQIGLFYRDIQWKFPMYRESVSWYKRCVSIPLYRYDLCKYGKLLNKFYLTSMAVKKYLEEYPMLLDKADLLPPGCESIEELEEHDIGNEKLRIFYVGGINRIYNLEMFLKVLSKFENLELVLCCRKTEWEESKEIYGQYMTPRIKIVHAMGEELEKYYKWADLCCAFAGKGEYMSIAMPIKVFEYLGHLKPMLGTADTEAGRFIEENHIGWSINYTEKDLERVLRKIIADPSVLVKMSKRLKDVRQENLWTERAKKVAKDLANNI
ncbi:glycosyltransferase family 1 protein [Mediterraneibacter massiliensis]|uniref:glycosyltransferase family 1 protein n=1 Tax=Mediterraneibacter massiliensis TaxID=1720300 RepID=UPI0024AC9980|nr:glycosyltransferase family 1 protein [Mediterraneibacter massiliensis]